MDITTLFIFLTSALIGLYFVEKISAGFNFYDLPDKKITMKKSQNQLELL